MTKLCSSCGATVVDDACSNDLCAQYKIGLTPIVKQAAKQAFQSPDSRDPPLNLVWLFALIPMAIATYFLSGTYVVVDAKTTVYSMPKTGGNTIGYSALNHAYYGTKLYEANAGMMLRCTRSEFDKMRTGHNTLYPRNHRRRASTGELYAKQTGVFVVVGSPWFGTAFRESMVGSADIRPFTSNWIVNGLGWVMVATMLFCVCKGLRAKRLLSRATDWIFELIFMHEERARTNSCTEGPHDAFTKGNHIGGPR